MDYIWPEEKEPPRLNERLDCGVLGEMVVVGLYKQNVARGALAALRGFKRSVTVRLRLAVVDATITMVSPVRHLDAIEALERHPE
jgi:hypothetical protein